jgi:hypothetical protein
VYGRGNPTHTNKPHPPWWTWTPAHPKKAWHRLVVSANGQAARPEWAFRGYETEVVFGNKVEVIQLLGESTAYIERSNLTSRLFNGRQVRKTLAFSKDVEYYRAAATSEDAYYNLIKPHKSLRLRIHDIPGRKWQPRTPAMAPNLTDHIWTVKELLTVIPIRF